jgi:integrase
LGVALRTGLRKGELLGLHSEDLDLDAGTASIRRTLQRSHGSGLATLPTKAISSERRIALPASCITSRRAHRARHAQEKEDAGSRWQGSGHVFTRPDGHPIEPAPSPGTSTRCSVKPACGPEHLEAVAAELNSRPRKTLDWETPAERLHKLLAA